ARVPEDAWRAAAGATQPRQEAGGVSGRPIVASLAVSHRLQTYGLLPSYEASGVGPGPGSVARRTASTAGTRRSETIAPTRNAPWMPPAVASTASAPPRSRATDCAVITVTNSAVPAAPATCWTVPTMALP